MKKEFSKIKLLVNLWKKFGKDELKEMVRIMILLILRK